MGWHFRGDNIGNTVRAVIFIAIVVAAGFAGLGSFAWYFVRGFVAQMCGAP